MKTKLLGFLAIVLGVFLFTGGAASASTADILQPAGATTNLESLRVGVAGQGGVTFFNGTVLNEGADPFTVGDDMRVDGEIWRTEKGGANPIKISDSVIPTLTNANDFGDSTHRWKSIWGKDADFSGNVDFTGANVTGLSLASHNHDGRYLKLTGGTVTGTATFSQINWSSPKTSYYSKDAYPCIGEEYQNDSSSIKKCLGISSSSSAGVFQSSWSINLPHNSEIKSLKANIYDNDSNRDLGCWLRRKEISKGGEGYDDIASVTTGPGLSYSPGWVQKESSTISNGVVNNNKYSYSIYCFHSGSVGVGQNYSNVGVLGFGVSYTSSSPN